MERYRKRKVSSFTAHSAGFFVMGINLEKLSGVEGPKNLAVVLNRAEEQLQNIKRINLAAGGRKAEFLTAELAHFCVGDNPVEIQVIKSEWNEEAHKHKYMVGGLSPALKIGVHLESLNGDEPQTKEPTIPLATDVALSVKEGAIHKHKEGVTRVDVEKELVDLLTVQRQFSVKSSIAGMRDDLQEGIVVNTSLGFTTSPITKEEIHDYVKSLTDAQLLRSPGGLLWPQEILQKHIMEVGGVGHDDGRFEESKMNLFAALLGLPKELDVLVRVLDTEQLMAIVQGDNSLFHTLQKVNALPINEGFKFNGKWAELIIAGDELYFLVEALPSHYEGMSKLAEDNFRNAPNYTDLKHPDSRGELDRYIMANLPSEIATTCERENRLSNHVLLNNNGKVVGFRIVRKEGEVADGRRLHIGRGYGGGGLGSTIVDRSEQYAKQVGCTSVEVHATGHSQSFFERLGYKDWGYRMNSQGAFGDKPSGFNLMTKDL